MSSVLAQQARLEGQILPFERHLEHRVLGTFLHRLDVAVPVDGGAQNETGFACGVADGDRHGLPGRLEIDELRNIEN